MRERKCNNPWIVVIVVAAAEIHEGKQWQRQVKRQEKKKKKEKKKEKKTKKREDESIDARRINRRRLSQ